MPVKSNKMSRSHGFYGSPPVFDFGVKLATCAVEIKAGLIQLSLFCGQCDRFVACCKMHSSPVWMVLTHTHPPHPTKPPRPIHALNMPVL